MRSIVYAGRDFSELCAAEVVERRVSPVVAEAMEVPGRAGALLVSSYVPPAEVAVRLFLDAGYRMDVGGLADARHRLSFWLCAFGGGDLVLPDEPEHTYRDALLTSAGAWERLFSDGQCTVTFTLFDPVAYGRERVEHEGRFCVGGTWPTLPSFTLTAAAGARVAVADAATGRYVAVERAFSGGELVEIGCDGETVRVDGADARADVALGSDFFELYPGDASIEAAGAAGFEARFFERWV